VRKKVRTVPKKGSIQSFFFKKSLYSSKFGSILLFLIHIYPVFLVFVLNMNPSISMSSPSASSAKKRRTASVSFTTDMQNLINFTPTMNCFRKAKIQEFRSKYGFVEKKVWCPICRSFVLLKKYSMIRHLEMETPVKQTPKAPPPEPDQVDLRACQKEKHQCYDPHFAFGRQNPSRICLDTVSGNVFSCDGGSSVTMSLY